MSIVKKVKDVKRKWIYIVLVVVIVLIAGGITAYAMHEHGDHHHGRHGDKKASISYEAYYNVLYLQNTDNLKISKEEAKALLPLFQKLSATTDKTSEKDKDTITTNIYKQLNSQQYYALISNGNNDKNKGNGKFECRHNKAKEYKNGDINDSIKDVVTKMLTDIASNWKVTMIF